MSGKRQHFIPRFLKKGFRSHTERGQDFTWVFRKESKPFNPNITNIGLETHFYTDINDTQLDEKITDAEYEYSKLIDDLRNSRNGMVANDLIPEFIAHMEVRTRHFRINFLQMSEDLVDLMISYLSEGDTFFEYAFNSIKDSNSLMHNEFVQEFINAGESKEQIEKGIKKDPEMLMILLKVLLPSSNSIHGFLKNIFPRERLSDVIKQSHINSLKKSIAPKVRINYYNEFDYHVKEFPPKNLILGDSPVLFKVNKENPYSTFTDKDTEILAIFLPLCNDKLLVGMRNEVINIDNKLPKIIAKTSMEYFISIDNSEENRLLQKMIGENARLVSHDEIENLVKETFVMSN
ncbi:MAG: DUF4238 domain-containing protein [Candidatus Paceibacterota bacterium]